jgi:hypothetical protein
MGQPAFVALAAAVIALLTQLSRRWFPTRYLPIVAVLLGAVSAVVDNLALGKGWVDAVTAGVVAATVAMAAYDFGKTTLGLGSKPS